MIESSLESWLNDHINFELGKLSRRADRPTLKRMSTLAEFMGDPQKNVPTIHITGTNGKTSTTRITESLMRAKGLYTGLFCSPHLSVPNERICLDGSPCSDSQFRYALDYVRNVENSFEQVKKDSPSYFEIFVGAAFELFNTEAVDVAVIEVGMGGLFDATNICNSKVASITNVQLDHMDYLGNSREEIAIEKSGIIKPRCSVAIGEPDLNINRIFVDKAKEVDAKAFVVDEDFQMISNEQAVGGRLLSFRTPFTEYHDVFLPLFGFHQGNNAMLSVVNCELFFEAPLGEDVIEEGFAKAKSPGRMEILGRNPLIIIDSAHNVAGALTFAKALDEEFERSRRIYVLGLTREKDVTAMINALGIDDSDVVIVTAVDSLRSMAISDLSKSLRQAGIETVIECENPEQALVNAQSLALDDDHIVITGSIYLVGEVRSLLV